MDRIQPADTHDNDATAPDGTILDWSALPWRVGRKLGRTIYVQIGPEPTDTDPVIGMMDQVAMAEHIVDCHNRRLDPLALG